MFFTINVSQLINAKKWLMVLVCFLIFARIDQILTTSHFICMSDWVEYWKHMDQKNIVQQ
jgi:hypothetical protein